MTVLLISDLHLQEERPDITRAFFLFLEQNAKTTTALYILGDLFEVWLGDDAIGSFEKEVALMLKSFGDKGADVFLMHGNRDFMIGEKFCNLAGCKLLPDPSLVMLSGTPVLLAHGDQLCTLDTGYQHLRRILRNPLSLWIIRYLPLVLRRKIGKGLRKKSRKYSSLKDQSTTDAAPDAIERIMYDYAVPMLIHGHTHRPSEESFQLGGETVCRVVLGDWEPIGTILKITDDGKLHLIPAIESI